MLQPQVRFKAIATKCFPIWPFVIPQLANPLSRCNSLCSGNSLRFKFDFEIEVPVTMIRASNQIMPQEARLRQGAWLFLAMLGVFFISCMILFLVYALTRTKPADLKISPLEIPISFIGTTFLLVGISASLHLAVRSVRSEQQVAMRRYLSLAFIMSMLFLLFQSFGMAQLVNVHFRIDKPEETLYGLTFFLALVHALHVVGGVVSIVYVIVKAWRMMYDHENYWGVVYCAWYWHFLDLVWLFMLISFVAAAIYA